MSKKIGIVIVNYNGDKLLNKCIKSIINSTHDNYVIIVVDNNSTDKSIEIVEKEFPNVICIKEKNNYGYAKGCNIGIKYALNINCDFIMLLNNDTVIGKELIYNLVKKANNYIITVPKMYYYDNPKIIWYAGGQILWHKGTTIHFGSKKYDTEKFNKIKYVDFATGCCMLIHRDIFDKIGMLDEKYFMYYEDADLSVRIKENGFKILYIPDAVLWHKVSISSGGENSLTSTYYCNRNRFYFIEKYYSKFGVIALFYTFVTRFIKYTKGLVMNNNDKIIYEAFKDYLFKSMYYKKLMK